MENWTVTVSLSYESLRFEFESAEEADNFARIAFNHIVREKDSRGDLRNVNVTIGSCLSTSSEEEE